MTAPVRKVRASANLPTTQTPPPEPEEAPKPTGATHRQIIPVGTVADVVSILPPVDELEADDLDIAEYHHQYMVRHVNAAAAFIDRSGVAAYMEAHHTDAKDPRGRKEAIPFRAIMTALWIIATDGGNLWMTNLRDVLFHKMTPESRAMLGITYPDRPTRLHDDARDAKTPDADRLWDQNSEKAVGRAFHRMLRTIDPSIHPKNRVMTWAELAEQGRPLTIRQQQEFQARLDWVCNRLLETAFKTLPRKIRRKYKGSACIDATPMPLFSIGRGKNNELCSSDPDGGFYGRQHGHGEPDDIQKAMFALDVSLVVAVDCHHGDRQYLPALPIGMAVDRPGMDPAGGARRIFAYLQEANYKMNWLAGDLLYTDQKPEKFQTPARNVGYKPVLGYGPKHHGRQGTHPTGQIMVEGDHYCVAMPEALIDATVNRRSKDPRKKTTHEQWQSAMKRRGDYLIRSKQRPDANGNGARVGCPASGAHPTAACPLKPLSMKQRKTRQPDGKVVDVRLVINPPPHLTADGPKPQICEQDTVTMNRDDHDSSIEKYRQELRYGTIQHTTTYVRLRQAQEGLHGFAKKHAAKALADPDARRVRGRAAQSLFAGLLLAAASVAKIRSFLHTAETDQAGERWVTREPLVAALRTPPGDEAPDPPPDELPAAA